MIKGLIKLILFIAVVLSAVYFWQVFTGTKAVLSSDQIQIRETYGSPEQFMITYLPRGSAENPQAVRSEVWYYPKHGKQVNFLAGEILAVEDFTEEIETVAATSLRPEDFDIYMNFDDVAAILGALNIERMEIPVLFEEGEVETYTSDQAIFIIEGDYLTYFQTIGIGAEDIIEEELLDETDQIEDSISLDKESFNFVENISIQSGQVLGESEESEYILEKEEIDEAVDEDDNTADEIPAEKKPKPRSGGVTTSFTIER